MPNELEPLWCDFVVEAGSGSAEVRLEGGFNGILPVRACSSTLDKALTVRLTWPVLALLHTAQVIAFIIVQLRQFFRKRYRSKMFQRGEDRSVLAWSRDNPKSGFYSSLPQLQELFDHD